MAAVPMLTVIDTPLVGSNPQTRMRKRPYASGSACWVRGHNGVIGMLNFLWPGRTLCFSWREHFEYTLAGGSLLLFVHDSFEPLLGLVNLGYQRLRVFQNHFLATVFS